jgi:hypothetical protein
MNMYRSVGSFQTLFIVFLLLVITSVMIFVPTDPSVPKLMENVCGGEGCKAPLHETDVPSAEFQKEWSFVFTLTTALPLCRVHVF